MLERTLSLIKPDAVRRNLIGRINAKFEEAGLKIIAQKMVLLTKVQAGLFYIEHREKPFYHELIDFMTSGPIIAQVLYGENAILRNREIMGKTNYKEAAEGTIRKTYATSIQENCVHGSDSLNSVTRELSFFFSELEIYSNI